MSHLHFALLLLLSGCKDKSSVDADNDGFALPEDCDDRDASLNPGAAEVCDGVDNNCDGQIDEDVTDLYYADDDRDGFGNDDTIEEACELPPGYAAVGGDCDDTDETIHPGATELCIDNFDRDCDGVISYVDADSDGWADCPEADCDDSNALIYPGAEEVCDDVDNNCDGEIDEGLSDERTTYYQDNDGDGYGVSEKQIDACSIPSGYAADPGDCDDTNNAISPGTAEIAVNGIDDDCDGSQDTTLYLSGADAIFLGEDHNDWAGTAVSGAGDVNSDGYADVLIGTDVGTAYLILGSVTGEVDLADADAKLIGEQAEPMHPFSVSGAGDVDGDGNDDLLIGAPGDSHSSSGQGTAYVVFGPVTGEVGLGGADVMLTGEGTYDYAGFSVSSAGDINNDGSADLIIGKFADYDREEQDPGAAYVILGPVTGNHSLASANATLTGDYAGHDIGRSVSGAGDVDGDGNDDLLIGSSADIAYVLLGPVTGSLETADADAALLGSGYPVSDAGDVNGDGYDDVLIGSTENVGYLVLGPISAEASLASDAHAMFTGESTDDDVGWSVSSAGDTNSDGNDDVLIGAVGEETGGGSAGAAYLVLGPTTGEIGLADADAKFIGNPYNWAGCSVSGAGDVDGDGNDDLLIGAEILSTKTLFEGGGAYLFFSRY